MGYYYDRYSDIDTNIDIKSNQTELDELYKTLNMLLNHFNIPKDKWEPLHIQCEGDIRASLKRTDTISDKIKECKMINNDITGYRRNVTWFSDAISTEIKASQTSMNDTYSRTISAITCRICALELLNNEYSKVDEWVVKCSEAAVKAKSAFRTNVETNLGYRGSIIFDYEKTPGTMEIDEELTNRGSLDKWNCSVGIDANWLTDVKDNDIDIVDIGGKQVLTLTAEVIPEHELLDDDVTLYQAKVFYSKCPRTVTSWSMNPGDPALMCHLEDKVIAVQSLPNGNIVTTGKDKSWAVRTMRGRMKKKMMSAMDLI